MTDNTQRQYQPQAVPHPGEMLVDYLEAYDWTQRELSRRSGLTPKTISEICSGKAPISPITALSLENVFRRPAHFWLNLQRLFDEYRARESSQIGRSVWADWAAQFPIRELRSIGMLPESGRPVDDLLRFFGVASPDAWKSVFASGNISYRQTRRHEINDYSVAAWVRSTEVAASEISIEPFDVDKLRESLEELRAVTRAPVETFVSSVQDICAKAGVAVVWIPALKKTGISGCARWLSDRKALVALTLRYKTDDQMWFTFFHEIGHLLLHRRNSSFILDDILDLDSNIADPEVFQQEEEANRFAADVLIPPKAFKAFVYERSFDSQSIYRFAEQIGISTGIVVGRLQKERYLRPDQGNMLKRKLQISTVRHTGEDH